MPIEAWRVRRIFFSQTKNETKLAGCRYNPHMQGIPWSTIALGSLLLISAHPTGGQEVKSSQPEKSKPPVKTEQRGRILGIGGVFLKSANRGQTRARAS